ncbi:hypothetical protein [Blastococcus sp. SYSU D00820]
MTTPDDATAGRQRAEEFLRLLDTDEPAAAALLEELTEVRELVFLGAGITAVARAAARGLPPAQRAQANTRQVRLGTLRDANRNDPAGLRTWLRRAGEEVQLLRQLQAAADAVAGQA